MLLPPPAPGQVTRPKGKVKAYWLLSYHDNSKYNRILGKINQDRIADENLSENFIIFLFSLVDKEK